MPNSEFESWTLLGDDHVPVESVERFLAYLASIEKSPNTIKAYAHDLKDWLTYLGGHGVSWQSVTLEDVAGFVAWLRLPPEARDGRVTVLPTVEHHCSPASVNRKLAALTSFCEFHARHGVALAGLLVTMQPAGRRGAGSATSYKPFLHHVTKSGPQRRRAIKLKTSRPRPKVLTAAEAQTILDTCDHLRDRLLFALLLDCGVRIGEALGLRHEDMGIAERAVTITPRPNDNRARAKAGISRTVPASAELMRLYADYLTREYGSLDSDYVFVNLWSQPHGRSRGPTPPSTTWSCACADGLGSTLSPTNGATPTRPGCFVGVLGWKASRSSLGIPRSPRRSTRIATSPSRTPGRRWKRRVGSPVGRFSCEAR
jgi:integrase